MLVPARRRQGAPPTLQTVTVPAPVGGLNTISSGMAMPATDCVQLYNMIAAEYGLRSRLGWREWCTGLTGDGNTEVRTVMSFTGSVKSGSRDRVFACTSSGIWDVTSSQAVDAGDKVLSFATTTGEAGYGVAHAVTTSAGHYLLYADEVNGLHVYTEGTDTWAAVTMGVGGTQISGVDPASIAFVTAFKNRVILVERDTATAWYLAAGAVFGAATAFRMGTRFRYGGHLVGLWSWTYDGGSGIDDSLVAVSSGGDVLVWQGTDIASANAFGLSGVWYCGGVPYGRRIATDFGGDMLLLARSGIVPMSKLVVGKLVVEKLSSEQYETAKIGNLFNSLMLSKSAMKSWSLRMHPEDNSLVVTVPINDGYPTEQLAMSMATRGWSRYRDLPIYSSDVYAGKLYFGTTDGRVCINDGYVDGLELADAEAKTAVQWSLLTSFQNLGSGRQKRVQLIRPTILVEANATSFTTEARYNYNLGELSPVISSNEALGSTWDVATWDNAVWGGEYIPTQEVRGATGVGTDVAIAVRGTAVSRTVLVGMEVFFDQGGPL